MLGIAIDESSATIADFVGGTTRMRTAVVDELAVGDVQLRISTKCFPCGLGCGQ
jgi:hypothetical protein